MVEACSHSRKLCVVPPVLLFQTSLCLSLSPRYIFSPPSPIQNAALFRALVLTHSQYNITDVIAQLIAVLKMQAAGSSKTWVIIHESTLHHCLHFLYTSCNYSVFQCDCGGVRAFVPGHLCNLTVRHEISCVNSSSTGCPGIQITTLQ
jgi:hypothetical protein